MSENDGSRFERLPATPADRRVSGRAARSEVLDWWDDRFGVQSATFDDHAFFEKGAGKLWAVHEAHVDRTDVAIEGLGLTVLRTRQEHWKPTTNAVCRFGERATRNVVRLDRPLATRFAAGETVEPEWDGDWGYLIAAQTLAGRTAPIGVGLYTYGELESMVPKGRRL